MKKLTKLYLSSLLIAIAFMTFSQRVTADQVCTSEWICPDNPNCTLDDARPICQAACKNPNTTTPNGPGKWAGNGTFAGPWSNDAAARGKCPYSVCTCTPPPPTCCETCNTSHEACAKKCAAGIDGSDCRLSCRSDWDTCAKGCKKETCTPLPPLSCCDQCEATYNKCCGGTKGNCPVASCFPDLVTCKGQCPGGCSSATKGKVKK